MLHKVLIANRGEIACRIIRTCKRLGVATVAVYSDADRGALHVRLADEAVHIGPAPAAESYLNADRIVAAARSAGADSVHPGYGFLSERAEFAEACAAAGLAFIGPPPAAIRAMGLKDAAKALMEKAGVPVVPGYHGDKQDGASLAAEADRIGWPVLIKAVAGGGGKGMRRVDKAGDFAAALTGAKREALGAFGDDRVLIEKYVSAPRHVEIQVFADGHGNAIHLNERDCSIQRRHQKVIEEAPAPGMTPAMRAAMGAAAVKAALAVGYAGAGTVEFIVDASEGLRADRFWFMEMNTRLQVEHPVTEAVTGLDLVELQVRVAAGEELPLTQADVRLDGHAFEVRLYAEEPERGFLPSTGRLSVWQPPGGARVDTGVAEGDEVTPYYDPMIAKIIVHAEDRSRALTALAGVLDDTRVAGVKTNLAFLGRLVRAPDFAAGTFDTGFVEAHAADLLTTPPVDKAALVVAAVSQLTRRARLGTEMHSPWQDLSAWRLLDDTVDTVAFTVGEDRHDVMVRRTATDRFVVQVLGGSHDVQVRVDDSRRLELLLDGTPVRANVVAEGAGVAVLRAGRTDRLVPLDRLDFGTVEDGAAGPLQAPLPGRVVQVLALADAEVSKGQALVVIEAMKMEHTIAAPVAGRVAAVHVAVGDQVKEKAPLVTLAQAD
jgi:3-methylcrotonyl-CoA carboxylase alpha subunit